MSFLSLQELNALFFEVSSKLDVKVEAACEALAEALLQRAIEKYKNVVLEDSSSNHTTRGIEKHGDEVISLRTTEDEERHRSGGQNPNRSCSC